MLDEISKSAISKASEQVLYHFSIPIKNGQVEFAERTEFKAEPGKVGLVAIFRGPKTPDIDGLVQNLLDSIRLEKFIPKDTNIKELILKKEYDSEENLECFIYRVD